MKRFIIFLILIALGMYGVLYSAKEEHEYKVVTFWTLQMGDYSDYMYKVIRSYEKENPNIHIKWVDVPFSEGEKRTLAAVMTDNPPDLINLNPDFSSLLAQKGTLEEINDLSLLDFNKEIVNSLKYKNKLYSIPWYATSAVTIYNKDLFKKSEVIRLPKTYHELAIISPKIKEKTGAYAYLPTVTENDTMVKILNKYGISELEDYPNAYPVFEMFKSLYKKNLIPKESVTFTHREALEQYMSGKIVFFQGGANFLNMIKENAPSVYAKTDVAEQIKGPIGQNDISVMNFVIPKRAEYKKEAFDFCLYLTNEENQLELARLTNVIATNEKALANAFYRDKTTLEDKARTISAKQLNSINPQLKQRRNQKEINNIVNNAIQAVMLEKVTSDEAIKDIEKKLQSIE